MAETLGSLVDKLSIKNLRLWHLDEAKGMEGYEEKRGVIVGQRDRLILEIDEFTREAVKGNVILREEKLKLYNKPEEKGLFNHLGRIGEAVDQLVSQNIMLWHLEDRIREAELPDAGIVKLKREIDKANQKRNDLIDKIDELFEKEVL